jgi:uncharacterized membrane protein YjjP (DUF1212 family)
MCSKCANQTPTGYRCRECIGGQQKVFETAQWQDLPLAFIASFVISLIGGWIAGKMGFFVIFIAPIVGTFIAEAARFITRRRRSQRLFQIVAAGAMIGGLPWLLIDLVIGAILFSAIWQGIYLVTVTTTAYYRMKGIFFNR